MVLILLFIILFSTFVTILDLRSLKINFLVEGAIEGLLYCCLLTNLDLRGKHSQ